MRHRGENRHMDTALEGRATATGAFKWAVAVLAIIVIALSSAKSKLSSTTFEAMCDAVMAVTDTSEMQEADSQMIRRLYGIDPNDYDGAMLYYPVTNMHAAELLIVKLKDEDQQDGVEQAISDRKNTLLKSFQGYGAEQTAMLENSITDIRGNYAFFCSAKDPEKVHDAFSEAY